MSKRSRNNNPGCCLVSLFLWPFQLLEQAINSLTQQQPSRPSPKSVQSPRRSVQQRQPSTQDRFVDVSPAQGLGPYQPRVSVSISYENGGTTFAKQAQKVRNKEGNRCAPVRFMHYWPTYGDMDASQKNWYFYWRSEARKGNYLPTDLSYIFVHVYEILNLIEFQNPTQAANRLKELWQAYRGAYIQLDRYLPEWGGDLLAVKSNPAQALAWWEDLLKVEKLTIPPAVVNTIVEKAIRTGGTHELPYKIWTLLSNYKPKNKFYQFHNADNQIDLAYEKAINTANNYYLRTSKKSLIDQFVSENIYNYEKYVFSSALIGYPHPQTIRLASGRNYVGSQKLADNITSIMKYAENILRKQFKFSAKLSGIELPVELAKELDAVFVLKKPIAPPTRIMLDPTRVAKLQQESQEVSDLLATDGVVKEKALLTDLQEVRALWKELTLLQKQLVAGIFRQEVKSLAQMEKLTGRQDISATSVIDGINNHSAAILGDELIYVEDPKLSLAEDFLDELEVVIQESPPEQSFSDTDTASDPWLRLLDRLDAVEAELIKLFAENGGLSEPEIETVAKSFNLMGSAVMDGLNEKALESIGHMPLYHDGEQWLVEEDDLSILQKLLNFEVK
jgi:hypothetical protein